MLPNRSRSPGRAWRSLPRLMKAGLVLIGAGGTLDIGYHLALGAPAEGHGALAFTAHSVVLIGMVLTMLGLIGAALSAHSAQTTSVSKGDRR